MLLRNKKTGEILPIGNIIVENPKKIDCGGLMKCSSLAELNDEWEDYNPKVFYYINENGGVLRYIPSDPEGEDETYIKYQKEIGNHFPSREESEKAVEKLKAITRLNKCGFKFEGYYDRDRANSGDIVIYAHIDIPNNNLLEEAQPAMLKDLDLLFSGGEE